MAFHFRDFESPVNFFRVFFRRTVRGSFWNHLLSRRLRRLSDTNFAKILHESGGSEEIITRIHEALRFRFFFHPRNRKDFFLNLLTRSQSFESILEEAKNVLDNTFETLGSGRVPLGESIGWNTDFKSGKTWPLRVLSIDEILDLHHPSDIKVPWELSRFHQVWWLGKAYWLTSDERYAEKFRTLIEHWIQENPPGLGANWTTAMEAAIRSCNWIAGYYFFCESRSLTNDFWLKFFKSLYVHGRFIENNLEYSTLTSNHFLSNVVGLLFLGIVFSRERFGKRWLHFALKSLPEEMERQVYPDGVDYEKSTSYHRLVLELFYTPAILCHRNNIRLPKAFLDRLEKMFDYMQYYTRPDGSLPLFGDADDGRLFRFVAAEDINDHRHALTVGAILFHRADFAQSAQTFLQDALWLFGGEGFEIFQKLRGTQTALTSRAFPDGRFYIMRNETMHLMVDAGDIGMKGRGGHGHNDTLSFEYWANGEPFIVDSGTYAYTSDLEARQQFRGVRAHNTIMVDERELVKFSGLWNIVADTTQPRVHEWVTTPEVDVLDAEHGAYRNLPSPVTVRRRIEVNKRTTVLKIVDRLGGSGIHSIESYLHFAPGILLHREDPVRIIATAKRQKLVIEVSNGNVSFIESWYSRSYGIREKSQALRIAMKSEMPVEIQITMMLESIS